MSYSDAIKSTVSCLSPERSGSINRCTFVLSIAIRGKQMLLCNQSGEIFILDSNVHIYKQYIHLYYMYVYVYIESSTAGEVMYHILYCGIVTSANNTMFIYIHTCMHWNRIGLAFCDDEMIENVSFIT